MKKLIACLTLIVFGSACFTTHRIPTTELSHLDGYDVHEERDVPVSRTHVSGSNGYIHSWSTVENVATSSYRVVSDMGTPITFTSELPLSLVSKNPGQEIVTNRYRHIEVDGGVFKGAPLVRPEDEVVKAIGEIDHAEIEVFDEKGTILAGTLIGLLVGTIITGVLLVCIDNYSSSDYYY